MMKTAGYTERDSSVGCFPHGMNRRDFLKRVGGGLIIAFALKDLSLIYGMEPPPGLQEDMNAYLRIGSDGRVSCLTGKIEMGQGVITSLAQMLADELDVRMEDIDMIMGDTELCPWDMGTWGSMTTRFFGPLLRAAGAEARSVLLMMAAERLSVPVDQLEAENGAVFVSADRSRKVSYAELTQGQEIIRKPEAPAVLKTPAEFKYIGKPMLRRDSYEKITGRAKYAGDIQLPGMLYARLLRPPSHFSKLLSADTSEAETMEGVEVVNDGDGLVAVLHKSPDMADIAISKVKAEWETEDPPVNDRNIFDYLMNSEKDSSELARGGDLETGREMSDRIFENTYLDGYVAHAPIENHTATAVMENGIMKIWASTQTPFGVRENIAGMLGLPEEKVHVIEVFIGGGFGGKSSYQQANEAARLAYITGKPVQVVWTRREEFFYDRFRPAAIVKITSGINDSGEISLWDYDVSFAGDRGAAHFYDIPHHRTLVSGSSWGEQGPHPFFTGPWRAPGNNTNTFARESQIDVMANAAGMDPLEFRLKHLNGDTKMAGVLTTAADRFGWTPGNSSGGRGFGVACGEDAGTRVAVMAEVEVDEDSGHVQVKRVACAQDMGLAINPQGATIQVEGCIVMGLGYALSEEIRFEGGTVLNRNFDSYEFTRFSWVPEIDVVIVDAKNDPPQGGGEPAIICMGGAIANAIFDATGARLYRLPMTPERVLEAVRGTGKGQDS